MKLSLIIPAYNRAAFLEQTLQSVLRQTRPPDEVLVVDDGSTDATRELVERFGHGVDYHFQNNAGLAAARCTGTGLTSGELLCFLDSDDLLLPRALEVLEAAASATPEAAVVYCRSQMIDAHGAIIEQQWRPPGGDHSGEVWAQLVDENFIRSSGCALIRRSLLDEEGELWDSRFSANEDWDMWLRLAERAPFARVDEALFQYRVHGSNMSGDRFHMHTQTFRMLRKHLARNRRHPVRRAYLQMALKRAREVVAHECSHFAREAQRRGDGRLATRQLSRALRLRPRYLLQPRFVSRLLRACCGRRQGGTPAWRLEA